MSENENEIKSMSGENKEQGGRESAPDLKEDGGDLLNNEEKISAESGAEETDGYTTDEDDIAYVAERITGARHTRAATAAPIRVREQGETMKLNSLSRRLGGTDAAEKPDMTSHGAREHNSDKNESAKKKKRVFFGYVFTAAAVVVLLFALVVGVNVAAEKNRPADFNIGETEGEVKVIGEEERSPVSPDEETDAETTGVNDESETDVRESEGEEGVNPLESESETEPETTKPVPTYNVTLDFYTREDINIDTEKTTLGELLEYCGVALGEGEVTSIPLDYTIAADTTVTIDLYEYETITETEEIPFESSVTETDLIPRGERNYTQQGEAGVVNKYYTAEIVNGVERNRTFEYEEIVKYPVDAIYEEGVGGVVVGSDGVEHSYSMRRVVPAAYYSIEGLTYLGTMADESVVAVNSDYIPLGTKMYVKNDTYDFGVRIASDVGGGIDGYEVDIWLSDSNPQKASFAKAGYHDDMEIYYLD